MKNKKPNFFYRLILLARICWLDWRIELLEAKGVSLGTNDPSGAKWGRLVSKQAELEDKLDGK